MTYTEIQERNRRKYYYRVKSVKNKGRVSKLREYLGVDLKGRRLRELEEKADKILNGPLNRLLTNNELKQLEKIQQEYRKQPRSTWENRYESFIAQFTYNSNAIEGNTLSLEETSFILFEHRTPKGKSLREINEALKKLPDFNPAELP